MQRGFSVIMIIFLVAILSIVGAGSFFLFNKQQLAAINSFDDCAKKYPVMESYPEQCNTPDGKHFVQGPMYRHYDISTEEKSRIDWWIRNNGLNAFGDKDITYPGGTPLYDIESGESTDLYDYIIANHPSRPWK